MRASQEARLGQEKPHKAQAPTYQNRSSAPTYHRWQQLYGGMKATEAKRLKELEQENVRLKRFLADAELDKAML